MITSPKLTFIRGWKFRKNGFQDLFGSEKYSDLVLICNGTKYFVHKIVLSYSSEFFHGMCAGEFKESSQTEIELGYFLI